MKANDYKVLSKCIEIALDYGFMRYQKYSQIDLPDDEIEKIKQSMEEAIINEICEYFTFNENEHR